MSKSGQETVKRIITDRIIEQLKSGTVPWHKPWIGSGSVWSRRNGKPYGIINQMMLDSDGEYATFSAIKKEGGTIHKGAKGQYIVEFWGTTFTRKDEDGEIILDENGDPKEYTRWTLRYQKVFNIKRDTDLPVKHHKDEVKRFCGEPIKLAEDCFEHYINAQGIRLSNDNSGQAFYSPLGDFINIPKLDQFEVVEEYYSTAFHEAAHSTGHRKRLDRLESTRFGSAKYGKEELVAELTSAAICNTLGIEVESTFQNSAAYIENWTNAIRGGEADIISASTYADKAYDMILDGFECEPDPSGGLRRQLDRLTKEYNDRFRKYWRVDPWSGTGFVNISSDSPDFLDECEMSAKIERISSLIDRVEEEYGGGECV